MSLTQAQGMQGAIFIAHSLSIDGSKFESGVGGTVAAIILMAETLAARGWQVRVGSKLTRQVVQNGVWYGPAATLAGAQTDLAVLVNNWSDLAGSLTARKRIFYYFDTRPDGHPDSSQCAAWASVVIVQSPFGKARLIPALSQAMVDRVLSIPIPIRLDDYRVGIEKVGNRILYSSMPDRGLDYLRLWFPKIQVLVPDAELHITGDFSMYGWPSIREAHEKAFDGVSGVHFHGRVTRAELVELQLSSKVLAFPCTFPEGFCIAAAEAMAAGVVPVTSKAFALATTVGSAGVLIPGYPKSGRRSILSRWIYGKRFVRSVVRLLSEPKHLQTKIAACRHAAASYSPAAWYDAIGFLVR